MRRGHVSLFVALFVGACGSSTATRSRLLEDEELAALRVAQPALVAEAESAESAAASARERGQRERAGDLETEARLLFDLATATEQSERFEEEARELTAVVESEAAVLSEAVAEREALVSSRVSRQARDAAMNESRRAFAIAEADEVRRLRRRSSEISRARLTAAGALVERIDLLSVATEAFGGTMPAEIASGVAALGAVQDGAAAVALAQTLHATAMSALEASRETHLATRERCQSLVNIAMERDFSIAFVAEGLVFRGVSAAQGNALGELLLHAADGPVVVQGEDSARMTRLLARQLPEERVHAAAGEVSVVLVPACVQR